MRRNYNVMRDVLLEAARRDAQCGYGAFCEVDPEETLRTELARLVRDGLLEGSIRFDRGGVCLGGEVSLTDEGREFCNLIENGEIWNIVTGVLRRADIDVPYPLLKEVCEEIVKRYVLNFIPEIKN